MKDDSSNPKSMRPAESPQLNLSVILLLESLGRDGPAGDDELADRLTVSESRVRIVMFGLRSLGLAERTKKIRKGRRRWVWSLNDPETALKFCDSIRRFWPPFKRNLK